MDEIREEPRDAAQGCFSAIRYSCLLNSVIVILLCLLIMAVLSALPPITTALAGVR